MNPSNHKSRLLWLRAPVRLGLLSCSVLAACFPPEPDPVDPTTEGPDGGEMTTTHDPDGDTETTGAPGTTAVEPETSGPGSTGSSSDSTTGDDGDTSDGDTSTGSETSSGGADDTGVDSDAGPAIDLCGNSLLDPGEVCDDGANDDSYDGCQPGCAAHGPHCGDGEVQGPEACDDGNLDDLDGCTSLCQLPACGDGIIQPGEDCEPLQDVGATCEDFGLAGGPVVCDVATCILDISLCTGCGNGKLDPGELCEEGDLAGMDCEAIGFVGGALHCNATCTGFDIDACMRSTPDAAISKP